jgi:uncharacterized membrane protein
MRMIPYAATRWIRPWRGHAIALLSVLVFSHLAAVWAVPRVIMAMLAANALPEARATGAVYLPAMTDHKQRRVVLPSPDLLYATCAFDLSSGPWRIRADPKAPNYWSIALYAANSDNFFVINDRQAAGAPVDLVLVGPNTPGAVAERSARQTPVRAPSDRGLLLMRLLVSDYSMEAEALEAARRTLRCDPQS